MRRDKNSSFNFCLFGGAKNRTHSFDSTEWTLPMEPYPQPSLFSLRKG